MSKSCIVCQQATKIWIHPKTHITYHLCLSCGVIFKDPAFFVDEEDEKKKYDEHENDIGNEGYVNFLMNFFESSVAPYIAQGHILDFGSGPTPVFRDLLTALGYKVTIYDYFYADDLSYLNDKYDLITMVEVAEHLQNPMPILEQLKSILKPGGYLSILTLFHPKDFDQFRNWWYIRDETHVVFYTAETFQKIADLLEMNFVDTNDYRYVVLQKRDQF